MYATIKNEHKPLVFQELQQNSNYTDLDRVRQEIEAITSQKDFNRNADSMEQVITIMNRQIDKWRDLEDYFGTDPIRLQNIEVFERKRDLWEDKKAEAERVFFEKKWKIKEEQRRMDDYSDMDLTDQENDTKNYYNRSSLTSNRYQRESSDDEENVENMPRQQRSRSPQLKRHRDRSPSTHATTTRPPKLIPGKNRVTKAKNRKWRPGQKALNEIRMYQKSTDMLIQKAPFARLVHEIVREATSFSSDYRIRADALSALQEAAEAFMVEMFEGSVLICNHAKRVTLMPTDIQLYRRLCLRNLS